MNAQRRDLNSHEMYLELRRVDRRIAEDFKSVTTDAGRIIGAAMRGGRLWLQDGSSGIIVPVQGTSLDSKHIAWVDWFNEARQVLDRQLHEAP